MSDKATVTSGEPLSSIFGDTWNVFTEQHLNKDVVDRILKHSSPPENKAYLSTTSGVSKAAVEFEKVNGDAFFKALNLLEGAA